MVRRYSPELHTALIRSTGHADRPRSTGLRGLAPAIASTNAGAVVVYLRGLLNCHPAQYTHNCKPRPLAAAMLDRAGRRRSGELLVTAGMKRGTAAGLPQVATSRNGTALVSWLRSALPLQVLTGTPFTRLLTTRPLRNAAPARNFPSPGGSDTRTPALLLGAGGESVAAGIGPPAYPSDRPAASFGYSIAVTAASARNGSEWSGIQSLSPAPGWSTSPRLIALVGDAALAVTTHSDSAATDAVRTVLAWFRPPGGPFSPFDLLGGRYTTRSAAGASAASAGDGSVIISWPARGGVVAVVSAR